MEQKYPNLCKPIQIGNVTFRNRMFSAPMGGTDITADGCIGRGSTAFYELRAKGGAAAVTVSECMVHPKTDQSHAYHLDLAVPGSLASFTYTADAISRHGAAASVELSHSGQYAGTYMADKARKDSLVQYGPSAGMRPDGVEVREMPRAVMDEIVKAYGVCAGLAKRAGFDMVMVHGGHGWLVNQFLSPFFNHRNDEYGGTLVNRTRFAREVLISVRNAVGAGFPIEFRMSGSELVDGGYTLEEGVQIAELLEEYVDLFHVSAGTYQRGFSVTHPSMFQEHGCNVYMAAEIKKYVTKPVATIGGLNDPEQMEEIISSGKADIVEMARALLADHQLPNKVMSGREAEIVKCLRCFTCMAERAATTTRRCTVNPFIGRELERLDETGTAFKPKKVLIAGAGPAGLQAAVTAARRGHQVILCERDKDAGGILRGEQAIPFKYEMYELGVTLKRVAEMEGVEFRFQTEVNREYVEKECPDALIAAVGSVPIVPPIEGIEEEQVVLVNDYHLRKNQIKDSVAVIGGGLAGCEIAVHLAGLGKQVSLIEMREELAVDANIRHRPILLDQVTKNIDIYTGHRGIKILPDGVLCRNAEGEERFIAGESIICAAGQKSCSYEALLGTAPYVRCVGDCERVANITRAIYQGHHAAMDI